MDGMKEQLEKELHTMKLSQERKEQILQTVRKEKPGRRGTGKWRYRTVLVSFVLLAISFTYINLASPATAPSVTTATGDSTHLEWMALLRSDWTRTAALLLITFVIYLLFKRNIRKQHRQFPACTNCGTRWTRKQTLSLGNSKKCPYCGETQYQTRKSAKTINKFGFFIPFLIIVAQIFNSTFVGLLVYILSVFLLYLLVSPYYIELQSNNPDKEPLW